MAECRTKATYAWSRYAKLLW